MAKLVTSAAAASSVVETAANVAVRFPSLARVGVGVTTGEAVIEEVST